MIYRALCFTVVIAVVVWC